MAARTQVVVGAGGAHADVLVVTAAPGADEDALGLPLVGQAERLLDRLLGEVDLALADVYITGIVKCCPPDGREAEPSEVANCSTHLVAQLEAVRPVVVVALGSVVTKLLRGHPAPIRERRGREEARTLGDHAFWLLPAFHPAAALYAPALVEQLRADLARLPDLVARGRPADVPAVEEARAAEGTRVAQGAPAAGKSAGAEGTEEAAALEAVVGPGQLELF